MTTTTTQAPAVTEAPSDEQINAATRVAGAKQTPFEAGCEVLAWLRENGAPYGMLARMSICIQQNNPDATPAPAVGASPEPTDWIQPIQRPEIMRGPMVERLRALSRQVNMKADVNDEGGHTLREAAALIERQAVAVDALVELRKQCSEVQPFANAVTTETRVTDMRRVGAFLSACSQADAAIEALAAVGASVQPVPEDPLQGAANWLVKALVPCSAIEIGWRLSIGHNRAQRLRDNAAKGGQTS